MARLTHTPSSPSGTPHPPSHHRCRALTFLFAFLLLGGVPTSLEEGCRVFLLLGPDGFGAGVRIVLLIAAGGGWGGTRGTLSHGTGYCCFGVMPWGSGNGCHPPTCPIPFFLLFFSFFSPFTWNMDMDSFLVLLADLALPSGSLLSPGRTEELMSGQTEGRRQAGTGDREVARWGQQEGVSWRKTAWGGDDCPTAP